MHEKWLEYILNTGKTGWQSLLFWKVYMSKSIFIMIIYIYMINYMYIRRYLRFKVSYIKINIYIYTAYWIYWCTHTLINLLELGTKLHMFSWCRIILKVTLPPETQKTCGPTWNSPTSDPNTKKGAIGRCAAGRVHLCIYFNTLRPETCSSGDPKYANACDSSWVSV